jgi:polar amino acid transport system substrate-binding protein
MDGAKTRATLMVVLAAAALSACNTERRAPRPEHAGPAPLRIVVPYDSPPYGFRRDGKLVGLEVEFARELAASLGRPLDLLPVGWADLIPTFLAGKADLAMAGLTITPAREVRMAFSDPYLRSGLLALMRRDDAPRYPTPRSVLDTGDAIGVVAGTTGERFVREHARIASPLVYPSATQAVTELGQRRVALVVHDAPVVIWFVSGDEANLAALLEPLDEEQLGWGMRRGDDALRTAVDAVLARWRTDGTRDRILDHWIPYWRRLESAEARR